MKVEQYWQEIRWRNKSSTNVQIRAPENQDNDGDNFVTAHIQSSSTVSAMLSEEEEMCSECSIPIGASSLRRAKGEIEPTIILTELE